MIKFLQGYPQILWIILVKLNRNYEASKVLINLAFHDNVRSQRLEHLHLAKINATTSLMGGWTETRQDALDIIHRANFWIGIVKIQDNLLKEGETTDDGRYISFKDLIERLIQKRGEFQDLAFSLVMEFKSFCTPEEYAEISILKWKWLLELEDWNKLSTNMEQPLSLASSQVPKIIEESDFGRMFVKELAIPEMEEHNRIRKDAAEAASLLRRDSGPFDYGSCADAIFSTIDEYIQN